MDFGDENPLLVEGFLNGVDFVVIYDRIPPRSWWKHFPFENRGVDFRDEPTAMAGWHEFAPFLDRVRYLSVTQTGREHPCNLEFLTRATRLEVLSVPPARGVVDVSHLRLNSFWGSGRGLAGLFDLPTLTSLTVSTRMPDGPITSPVDELCLMTFPQGIDLSALASPSTLERLTVVEGKKIDLSRLANLTSLSSLILGDCGSLLGVDVLASLPALQRLVLIDCPDIPAYRELAQLRGVRVEVGGENVFDDEFRSLVSRAGDSTWRFPTVFPPRAGESWYLIHPGLARALRIPDQVDDNGPGELVTDRWESLQPVEQQRLMVAFLDRAAAWLREQGVAAVEDEANGQRVEFEAFDVRTLLDPDEYVELRFETADGSAVARITETVWNGIAVQTPRRPTMSRFR